MSEVTIVLVFLLAVVASSFLSRLLRGRLPLPLLQIGIGAGLSTIGFEVAFEPHLFLLLFIPPLLFLDGWRIPKGAFFHDWKPILTLAIGLVVFTVVGMGWFIHWLVPIFPVAVAFALAAILSPTDPVAVGAMTANAPMPSRLLHILEGESLLNDATGLVCFTFAVAAVMTGTFSITDASVSFVLVAGGGVLIGVAVTWLIGLANRLLIRHSGEDPSTQILISLLMPFAAYLAAEHLHASGILAAAVAGIAMHYRELTGRPQAATRMQRTAVWDTVQTALNGIIFVLLGEQLPPMLRRLPEVAVESGLDSAWELGGIALVITLALGLLRFAWVWTALRVVVFGARLRGQQRQMPRTRLLAVTATAGVRGAITLAGILTLPLLLPDGSSFPGRDAAVFLAMGVILISLAIASLLMPWLTRGLDADLPEPKGKTNEDSVRIATAEAAIRRVEAALSEAVDEKRAALRAEAAARVLDVYRRRIEYGDPSGEYGGDMRKLRKIERGMRLDAIQAERDELYRLHLAGSIDDVMHRAMLREVDLREASLAVKPAGAH